MFQRVAEVGVPEERKKTSATTHLVFAWAVPLAPIADTPCDSPEKQKAYVSITPVSSNQ